MCFEALAQSTYVSIESYRRDGRSVRTPVNITSVDHKLYCLTFGHSGKVKRIRNNEDVKLAKCDARGNLQGEWVPAKARVIEDRDEAQVLSRRLADKHGLTYMIAMPLFRLYCFLRGEPCLCIEFSLV
ncbi:MAG: PPOX class F420-dependent oxidoreductase [Chloroflexi bacterium]|nr:PPOX class F420-dependent oxidoreductase [Chloroflexota bacterium]